MRAATVVFVVVFALVAPRSRAFAFEEFEGTRATGMGGATRAWAVGDSGPLLNPSGMTLVKGYDVEASYAYSSHLTGQFLHASVVDSTSASTMAGGLYYTYRTDAPPGDKGHGHEVGASLAAPLGNYLSLGVTAKWFRLDGADEGPNLATGGLTFDCGITVRPIENLSLAFVAANLRDLHAGQVPQTLSYGAAYVPTPTLVLAVDGLTSFTRDDVLGTRGTGVRGGVEWTLADHAAVRAGGGTDPMLGVGYLAGGLSVLSEIGAVDVAVRSDLFPIATGSVRNVFVGVSLRLFASGAVTSAMSTTTN
jgi:hypothetical protein